MTFGVVLGAPKVISVADEVRRTLGAVRMDICAFVGVAPRGPVRRPQVSEGNYQSLTEITQNWQNRERTVATAIDSWDQYNTLFGGFDGPGRLPFAVANFFEQGGQRAYISRIVHHYNTVAEDMLGTASAQIINLSSTAGNIDLVAKNEGEWGNNLRAAVGFEFQPIEFLQNAALTTSIIVTDLQGLVAGDLLRVVNNDADNPANNFSQYRFVQRVARLGIDLSNLPAWELDLGPGPLPGLPTFVQRLTCQCIIEDINSGFEEHFANLSFSPSHQRFIGAILYHQSILVDPHIDWLLETLLPPDIDPDINDFDRYAARVLLTEQPSKFNGGMDRYRDIVHEDFFDASWVLGNEYPGDGIHSLTHLKDCSLLVIPDLYVPEPFEVTDVNESPTLLSGAEFAPCVDIELEQLDVEAPKPKLPGLLLDPRLVTDLQSIVSLQQRAMRLAEQLKEFILLLDVPPSLTQRQVVSWRTQFNSAFCAAYHPWLKINRSEGLLRSDTKPILLNPSAVAAGIIAATEIREGISQGPANQVAHSVFALDLNVTSEQHDQLHPIGVNVFKQQRDGVWLTGARSMSQQSPFRQISVVRFMVMLRRALLQQMQWIVFEPNTSSLWLDVRFSILNFLRQLYIAGAFKGESEEQAFFVKCDASLNTRLVVDAGQLIAEIGVAPVEPLEFILLRIQRGADGTLKIVSI